VSSLSKRFASALIILLGLALVPLFLLPLRADLVEPCASPDALLATSQIRESVPSGQREGTTAFQWSEGTVANPLHADYPLQFQIIRSYEGRRLYERPVSVTPIKIQPESHVIEQVETARGSIPVHFVVDGTTRPIGMAGYLVVDGLEPVRSPVLRQLWRGLPRLLTGRPPITLMIVSGSVSPRNQPVLEERMQSWLVDAWEYFDRVCRVPAAGN